MVNVKSIAMTLVLSIVAIIVAVTVLGDTIDDVQTAGNAVNATGAPLSSLFAGNGILVLALLAGVFIAVLGLAFKMGSS